MGGIGFGDGQIGQIDLFEAVVVHRPEHIAPGRVQGGNVAVDLVARGLPRRLLAVVARAGEALFALLVAVILVQLTAGAIDLARFGETTMVLQLPVWWAYGPAIASTLLWLLVILARLFAKPAERGG